MYGMHPPASKRWDGRQAEEYLLEIVRRSRTIQNSHSGAMSRNIDKHLSSEDEGMHHIVAIHILQSATEVDQLKWASTNLQDCVPTRLFGLIDHVRAPLSAGALPNDLADFFDEFHW